MTTTVQIGQMVRTSKPFETFAGAAVDPTSVVFKYRNPAGTVVTLTYGVDAALVKDSTGNYHVDLILNTVGAYWLGWYGTTSTTYSSTSEEAVYVEQSLIV